MLARRTSDARPAEGENGFTGFDLRHDSISEQRQGEGSAGDRAYSINVLKPRQFIPVLILVAGLWAYHNSFRAPAVDI
jgi:hypothetical protein